MRKVGSLLCMLLLTVGAVEAAEGQISGVVVDRATGEPLENANIVLSPCGFGTATDAEGRFQLSGIPEGVYDLRVSFIGYSEYVIRKLRVGKELSRDLRVELIPTVLEMEEVMVTGKRGRSLTWELPVSAEVISALDIARANAVSVADAMRPVVGAFVKSYGHLSSIKSLSVRGSSFQQVLILWDGARINSPLAGGFDLSIVPLDAVEKIEFVRSGLSSLYGADAAGGVLNLIGRTPNGNGHFDASLQATLGSLGSQYYQVQASQRIASVSYLISGSRHRSNGKFSFEAIDAATSAKTRQQRENADCDFRELFGKVVWNPTGPSRITVTGEMSETKRGAPGRLDDPSPKARQTDETKRVQVGFETLPSSKLHLQAQSFFHEINTQFKDPNPLWPEDAENKGDAIGSSVQSDIFIGANTVTIGGSHTLEKSKGTSVSSKSRHNFAFFSQDEFVWRNMLGRRNTSLTLLPSVRFDRYSDFGNVFSPKVGILLSKLGQKRVNIRASAGRSFRAPTFNDLYWLEKAGMVGNPNLRPERVTNFETGLTFSLPAAGEFIGEVSYFARKADDLIDWGEDLATGNWTPVNISRAKITGQEVRLKWEPRWSSMVVEANYTHLEALNRSGQEGVDGKILIYRPSHTANLRTGLQVGPAFLNATVYYVGSRYADVFNTIRLSDYTIMDANLGLHFFLFKLKWRARVEVDNIFDKSYQVVDQYPMPGRLWRVTVGMGI